MKDNEPEQPKLETLSQYLKRIMGEKRLTLREVEERSANAIATAYVANILRGTARNLSVDKLKALAVGLGESEETVFKVARSACGWGIIRH